MRLALAILLAAGALRTPPLPYRTFTVSDTRKGAQVLMDMARASVSAVSPLSAFLFVGPLAIQDVAIARSLSPNTFAVTVNNTNGVLQVSTNGVEWADVYNDRSIYSDFVGYDVRPDSSVFFRLKP